MVKECQVATQLQIAANRMNAQRSTGPRTEDGKATSSRNALQHGLTAKQILLEGEDPDLFVELLQALRDQFQPYSRMGEELVERLAGTMWRLRRIPVFEAALLDCIPPDQKQSLFDGTSEVHRSRMVSRIGLLKIMIPADAYAKLDRHEAHLARQVERILEQLRQLEKERPAAAVPTTPDVAFTVNIDLGLIARMVLGLFPRGCPA